MKKEPMIDKKKIFQGCSTCSGLTQVLDMRRILAVGFGDVTITRNGDAIYSEQGVKNDEFPDARQAEAAAADDPEQDWRINFLGPLHEETYQRQGVENWVMISSGPGFA